MTDRRLRAAFLDPSAGPGPDCPSEERIFDAATGRLPAAEVEILLDHVAHCGWCAVSWSVAHRAAQPVRPVRRRLGSRIPLGAALGGLVIALAAGLLAVLGIEHTASPTYRSDALAPLEVDAPARLPRGRFLLTWEAPEGRGWSYDLEVSTEDLQPIYEVSGLELPSHQVPAERLAGLAPGARLLCTLKAHRSVSEPPRRVSFVVTLE